MTVGISQDIFQMHRKPRLSILLSTRNRSQIAYECARRILSSERNDFELIIRNNGSQDDTRSVLASLTDSRLQVISNDENQGTRTFFEIAKLASGDFVTWISDEDNFDFDVAMEIVSLLEEDRENHVAFGGIIVGKSQHRVVLSATHDPSNSKLQTLHFSGCGGLFIRRVVLAKTLALNVDSEAVAYKLWNYYPIGFFASRCVGRHLPGSSRVVVTQSRFADTTHNWSQEVSTRTMRLPHYYPRSEFDRLVSNTMNALVGNWPMRYRLQLTVKLILVYTLRERKYLDPNFINLLRENYSQLQVDSYVDHIRSKHLDNQALLRLWTLWEVVLLLPFNFLRTWPAWRSATKLQAQ